MESVSYYSYYFKEVASGHVTMLDQECHRRYHPRATYDHVAHRIIVVLQHLLQTLSGKGKGGLTTSYKSQPVLSTPKSSVWRHLGECQEQ